MKAFPAESLPVLPVRQLVVFPGITVPIKVNRPKSVAALEKSIQRAWPILVITQRTEAKDPKPEHLYKVGTLCELERVRGNRDDGYQILVRGVSRYRVLEFVPTEGIVEANGVVWKNEDDVDAETRAALLSGLKGVAQDILELLPNNNSQLSEIVSGIDDLDFLVHLAAANLDLGVEKKQEILESISVKRRALSLLEILQDRKNNLEVQSELRHRLADKFGKEQRRQILREQMRLIREELGENGGGKDKKPGYRERIEQAEMPKDVKETAFEELRRLDELGNNSPESHIIKTYLDLLCSLPWNKSSSDQIELDKARSILDTDHYGLKEVKKRILQHLAVMKLLAKRPAGSAKRGSILLFVGPPGVGKTSLGQSIAKALGRKFVRVSLGGVRDDAEIRGHRRTYVGALPGRIIQGLKRAGENNPVMMLDEVDKLGVSLQGDPAAALLEVLDPEQNRTFHDHYLDLAFDLSKVFFIATANSLETIPGPLLDRMEIIEISGYTTAEKFHIAKAHLVPKQMGEHGLAAAEFSLSDEALLKIINDYTREAGVRNLQRRIASVCRASTEKVLENETLQVRIEAADLEEILGPERYVHEVAERIAPPGVVTGLAWTPVGGEILFIESSLMKGNGKLILTGQLGDVMKESAQIALSLVKSRLAAQVGANDFETKDIHVHVPQGAIPKDGPSAGVAIATALASLLTGVSVDPKLAMTGEITLRGSVMPVGGIKEKLIAAHRAGITRVILSAQNKKDLRDIPEEVRAQVKLEFVDNISELFLIALGIEEKAMLPINESLEGVLSEQGQRSGATDVA